MHVLNNFAMALGYLVMIVIIGLASWYAVVAYRRHRAGRKQRMRLLARAQVESEPVPPDQYGDAPLGI